MTFVVRGEFQTCRQRRRVSRYSCHDRGMNVCLAKPQIADSRYSCQDADASDQTARRSATLRLTPTRPRGQGRREIGRMDSTCRPRSSWPTPSQNETRRHALRHALRHGTVTGIWPGGPLGQPTDEQAIEHPSEPPSETLENRRRSRAEIGSIWRWVLPAITAGSAWPIQVIEFP